MRKKYKKWDYDSLHKVALKYKTRGAFRAENRNAYQACQSRDILDDVCSHMGGTPYVKWTDKMLHDEARKYKSRKEFRAENRNAYQACCNRGILSKVCRYMKKPLHHKIPNCVYLIEIFTKNNELYYYVGQTSDLKNRLYKHFRYGSNSPVSDFLNKTPKIKYKKHYIVKDNLTYKESLKLEKETIKNLQDSGAKLLNKVFYRI